MTVKVVIDGEEYKKPSDIQKEAMDIMRHVYGVLWTEAYYDPYCVETESFAKPLAEKMKRLNELMKFKE